MLMEVLQLGLTSHLMYLPSCEDPDGRSSGFKPAKRRPGPCFPLCRPCFPLESSPLAALPLKSRAGKQKNPSNEKETEISVENLQYIYIYTTFELQKDPY